jgi:hypothetical protein
VGFSYKKSDDDDDDDDDVVVVVVVARSMLSVSNPSICLFDLFVQSQPEDARVMNSKMHTMLCKRSEFQIVIP